MDAPTKRTRRDRRRAGMAVAVAAIASAAAAGIGGGAQAATYTTRNVNAIRQANGIGCGETRLAAAVAFQDKRIVKARCLGQINRNPNKFAISSGTTGPTVFVATKFFNPSTSKWRIAVTRRSP
jgi:hypothetical protein